MNYKNLATLIISSAVSAGAACAATDYVTPYSVVFKAPVGELLEADKVPPRDNWQLESAMPHAEWYSRRVRREFGAWAPAPRRYPPIRGLETRSEIWKRQRLLAVALKYVGLPYQHHHIPDWNPPQTWTWKPVAYGRNSKGVDCSDFTSWVYNYGLGIKMSTGIRQQAEAIEVKVPFDGDHIGIHKIHNTSGYKDLVSKLKTGDLLYIKSNAGKISHVIMWVGEYGKSPNGTPLVIDCTGPEHTDCNGNRIPIGVQLRPFLPNEWYYKSFAHANRIIHDES